MAERGWHPAPSFAAGGSSLFSPVSSSSPPFLFPVHPKLVCCWGGTGAVGPRQLAPSPGGCPQREQAEDEPWLHSCGWQGIWRGAEYCTAPALPEPVSGGPVKPDRLRAGGKTPGCSRISAAGSYSIASLKASALEKDTKASLRAGGGDAPTPCPGWVLRSCPSLRGQAGCSDPVLYSFLHAVWGQIWPLWVPPLGISHTARQPG